ncbi:MFS transporter [Bittarella sp. HCP28S3_D9]|uniref:MFS transporter n=1 Tax=Bittarella sp. HCP28S3_D9 TaxID=3440253 RepID=UPI003F8AAF1E
MQKTRKPFFYGWVIVGAAFVVMAVSMGIATNCFSLFIKPICAHFGFSRQSVGAMQTISNAAMMVTALLSGRIFSRFAVKQVMKVSSIALTVSFFCYSLASSIWVFYLISAVLGLALGTVHMVPLSILLSNWFHEKRGFALGLAFMGSGVGGMLFNSLAGVLIEGMGWRVSFQILAAIMGITLIPIVFFVIRNRPEDMGLLPLGEKGEQAPTAQMGEGFTFGQVVKTPRFWAFCLCIIVSELCMYGLMINIAPHVSDVGYSLQTSALISAACMGSLAVGKLLLGTLYDKLGIRIATLSAYAATVVGLIGCLFAHVSPLFLVLVVLGAGLGCAYGSVAYPILTQSLYGLRDYSAIYGFLTAFTRFGDMLTPLVMGAVFDSMGSYRPAYATFAVTAVAMAAVCQLIFPRQKRSAPREEALAAE